MLEYIREDATVYVEKLSGFGRSAANLLATVQYIENVGAKFVSFKENFDTKMRRKTSDGNDGCYS